MAINVSHPIGQYLRWALLPSDSLKEQATGAAPGGSAGTTVSLPQGAAYVPVSSYTTWATPISTIDPYNNSVTIAWYGKIDTTGAATLAQYVAGYGWSMQFDAWAPNYILLRFNGWWGGGGTSTVINLPDATVHHIAIRFRKSAGKVDIFLDGVAVATDVTWAPDPGAVDGSGVFRMANTSASCACITAQVYEGALSDSDIASLAANPLQVFVSPPVSLMVNNAAQDNSSSGGIVGIGGVFYAGNAVQANVSSSGQITRTQALTIDSVIQSNSSASVSINPYGRLKGILAATPLNTWVKVNSNSFLDVTIPTASQPPYPASLGNSASVVYAWSSFAFDTDNGQIVLFGGGHANYYGNEVYLWKGDSGLWSLGSLPSKVDFTDGVIPSKDGPQSSHTYSNNVYLLNNKMFCTFGGAAAKSGGPMEELVTSSPHVTRRVGPWVFDVSKADPNKVGGGDATGWDATALGSGAWNLRFDKIDATDGSFLYDLSRISHVGGATIVVDEDGVDVAYFTMDGAGSGQPYWCKYVFGNIRAGGRDTFTKIGATAGGYMFDGFGIYDSKRGMMYRNSIRGFGYTADILALRVKGATGVTATTPIQLKDTSGTDFVLNDPGVRECHYGAVYDPKNDRIWLWLGAASAPNKVYYIDVPAWSAGSGWSTTIWTVNELAPTGASPRGNHPQGILGKMRYVPTLGAFVVLDSTTIDRTDDPGVWMFKTADLGPVGISLSPANAAQVNAGGTGAISISTGNLIGAQAAQINLGDTGFICQIGVVPDGWLASQTVSSVLKKPGIPTGTPDWLKTMIEILTGRRCNKIAVPPLQNLTFSATVTKAECEALYSYVNDIRASLDSLMNRLDG